jgi:hypothetical protein
MNQRTALATVAAQIQRAVLLSRNCSELGKEKMSRSVVQTAAQIERSHPPLHGACNSASSPVT